MRTQGVSALFLGMAGAVSLLASFMSDTMPAVETQQLAAIWGGRVAVQDPIEPQPAIKKCEASNDTCKSLYNAASPCFGKSWIQSSACPTTQTCIPNGQNCTHQSVLKRCIGVPVEACNDGAVPITCGVVDKAGIGACSVSSQIVQIPGGGYAFQCSTVADQCRKVGGPTDLPCTDRAECQ